MSIRRGKRPQDNYTRLKNEILNDEDLSADALGVLVYLLSKPDDWTVMPCNLQNRFKCGRDKIYRILSDLQKAGYARIEQARDNKGVFGKVSYVIHEEWQPLPETPEMDVIQAANHPLPENPETDGVTNLSPCPENPYPGNPYTDNPPLLKTESTKDREEEKKESKNPSNGFLVFQKSSDWPSDYQELFWKAYPRKTEKKSAMAKLDAIRKSGKVPWAVFAAGVNRYRHHVAGTEERYIKHPTTWLNRGCWDDEFSNGGGMNGKGIRNETTGEDRTHSATCAAPTRGSTFLAAMGRTLERRREARVADDARRENVQGSSGTTSGDDAERRTTKDDAGPRRQLVFITSSDSGQ